MLIARFSRLLLTAALISILFIQVYPSPQDYETSFEETARLLPDTVGNFRAEGVATVAQSSRVEFPSMESDDGRVGAARRIYRSGGGERAGVIVVRARSDSAAYAVLMEVKETNHEAVKVEGVGTAAFAIPSGIIFFKGPAYVLVYNPDEKSGKTEAAALLARSFADTLDKGANEIPVLVKHLPEWETVWEHAPYALSLEALQRATGEQPILKALSFEGGAEAVTTTYGPSRLVIVENTTPQLATTQDARINARLKELRDAGQPVPSLYRRVGNYSVFVFDAPDEATAVRLVDGIKYEQVVQWLGDNPNDLKRAQRRYTETTAGVILAVLKASGLSLLLCLGVGAVFGGIVFRRRRQQQTAQEAFSDAGGMVRLNLDELSAQYDSGKLLGPGKQG